jgi:hypothetical protein
MSLVGAGNDAIKNGAQLKLVVTLGRDRTSAGQQLANDLGDKLNDAGPSIVQYLTGQITGSALLGILNKGLAPS